MCTNGSGSMFFNLLMEMTSSVADIICIAQITFKLIYNLKGMFFKPGYPDRLVDATVTSFLNLGHVGGKHRSGHTTFQRSKICGLRPKTAQRSWQQHRQSNTNGIHESKNWRETPNSEQKNQPSLANNALYINLNVIFAIQIISATLLVISIRELKNIEPLPLVHM